MSSATSLLGLWKAGRFLLGVEMTETDGGIATHCCYCVLTVCLDPLTLALFPMD